ncbi:MAG: beta-galactosidase, partial [Anaerolineae bacterium]|nr:beta-galactosidase [Anaerolineae bacterium]
TLNRYRSWLEAKYGGLEALNAAWQRRYTSWDDVRPGKRPDRPYTEMMAFQDFIAWRSVQHAYDRYDVLKSVDAQHPVTVHGAQPTVLHGTDSYPNATALHRGNDWGFSDRIDGIGTSSFPLWGGIEMDRAQFVNRIDYSASARQGKRLWLSELQGGRSNIGFGVAQSVDAASQQSWVWTGISAGADAILFWCWRDEVFGRESTGFGLAGNDGLAPERLAAMRKSGDVLKAHGDLLRAYEPAPAQVGILFSPQAYYLYWSQDGTAHTPLAAIQGYARALTRQTIPYRIVEENHLDALKGLKILILPRTVVMDVPVAEALAEFVRRGGVLFCESEVGSFDGAGIYRYPENRFFAELTGIREVGRRQLEGNSVTLSLGETAFTVPAAQWLTPLVVKGGETLLAEGVWGKGRVLLCGTYLGDAYLQAGPGRGRALEEFLLALVTEVGVMRPAVATLSSPAGDDFVHVRFGAAPGTNGQRAPRPVAFVFAPDPGARVEVVFQPGTFQGSVVDLLSGSEIPVTEADGGQTIVLGPTEWGISVLVGKG